VLKLYFDPGFGHVRDVEMAAMAAAKAAGAPSPAAFEAIEVEGRPGLVMERCDGIDMLTQLGTKPWAVFDAGRALGVAHAQLHAVAAPSSLHSVKERLPKLVEGSPLIPADLQSVAIDAVERLPDDNRLCHGDFHPANVIQTPDGPRVIDWPNAYSGNPDADVARTLLMLHVSDPPAGTSAVVRIGQGVGRRILNVFYKRGYRSQRPFTDAQIDAWMLPVAIHRLRDDIKEEREKLLAFIAELRARTGR
jgi:aminoglycoside phosphotransferase (APT) family kinase protein